MIVYYHNCNRLAGDVARYLVLRKETYARVCSMYVRRKGEDRVRETERVRGVEWKRGIGRSEKEQTERERQAKRAAR